MTRRIFRHRVAVNDEPHQFKLTSDPLHVEAGQAVSGHFYVDFWTIYTDDAPTNYRSFRVFGTGQPIPDDAKYIGTTARTAQGGFVWHLFEVTES